MLVIEGAPPNPMASAGERACLDLIETLLERGDRVGFAAIGRAGPGDDRLTDQLRDLGVQIADSTATGIPGIADALDEFDPEVAITHRPGPALAAISALTDRPEVVRVYWGHDIHAWRLAAQNRVLAEQADHRERLTVLAERRDWDAYDVCVYPTAREADFVNAEGGCAEAIPYYRLTEQDLPPAAPHHGRRGALLVGGSAHLPNRDAVEFTIAEVLPLLGDFPLTVVGQWHPDLVEALQRPNVTFTGMVDEQRLRELHQEHVCLLAPLRFGAGTRRKLVSAMGFGLPVVTTSEGVRGLLVTDATADDGVLIADTPAGIAAHVLRLAHDETEWRRLSAVATSRIRSVYGADAYAASIERVLQTGSARRDGRST